MINATINRLKKRFHCEKKILMLSSSVVILGEPGAVSRVGRKGMTKVFKYGFNKKPLGTDSHRTISKSSSGSRLLIGHKKCFVLLCPISKQFLLSSFREFVHDSHCLSTLARFVHQACACKRNFYFLLS